MKTHHNVHTCWTGVSFVVLTCSYNSCQLLSVVGEELKTWKYQYNYGKKEEILDNPAPSETIIPSKLCEKFREETLVWWNWWQLLMTHDKCPKVQCCCFFCPLRSFVLCFTRSTCVFLILISKAQLLFLTEHAAGMKISEVNHLSSYAVFILN